MTNEELAIMAAQGDTESLHKLYFAVAPLIYKITSRYFKYCETNRKGVRPEDLTQCGYFAYLSALKQYSPERELKFTSYLDFCVARECWRELGISFQTGGKVLNREVETISLETPISDDEEGLTLEDIISDPDADTYSFCELNDMRLIVRREIERLSPREQCVIYGIFYNNKTIEGLAQEFGCELGTVLSVRDTAFNSLRRSKGIRELRKAYNWNNKRPSYLDPEKIKGLLGDSGLEPI
ncbi:hypothetical protein HM1_0052 [Heliomicrobium modesticaldum Ice1]|uniref:Uncharacterized protein n=1 Tax=Heliobacterium modesticaldum (strain ATCC 51547 / Ice1) TaxID=498761 RepID=B0TI04_HELMI|nr:sigma factor-like helix-turn-helix DNA-binding protein [Heliomicrobium modesticaldum]ABZ82677.1 hypothetical protein HM1_0052 [Heliomicrobium modesticaldum Ice1]